MVRKDRGHGFQARELALAPRDDKARVCVAQIGAPHGVRGEVRLKSFTEAPENVGAYGPLETEDGHSFEIEAMRPAKGGLIARLAGVGDRSGAEALRGLRLYVPRARLPETGDAETFYQADLVGLAAVDTDGVAAGTVTAVHNFGGGDLIEVRPENGGATVLLPFTKAVVPRVDIAAGLIVIEPPDGLREAPRGRGTFSAV